MIRAVATRVVLFMERSSLPVLHRHARGFNDLHHMYRSLAASELHQGESGSYTEARVIVTDSIKKGDDYVDGPAIAYDVAVSGKDADRLVATAERDGNVRVLFAGRYYVTEYTSKDGTPRLQHNVQADQIGVSFRGQDVHVPGKKQQPSE